MGKNIYFKVKNALSKFLISSTITASLLLDSPALAVDVSGDMIDLRVYSEDVTNVDALFKIAGHTVQCAGDPSDLYVRDNDANIMSVLLASRMTNKKIEIRYTCDPTHNIGYVYYADIVD